MRSTAACSITLTVLWRCVRLWSRSGNGIPFLIISRLLSCSPDSPAYRIHPTRNAIVPRIYLILDFIEGDMWLRRGGHEQRGRKYNKGQFEEDVSHDKARGSLGPTTEGLTGRL